MKRTFLFSLFTLFMLLCATTANAQLLMITANNVNIRSGASVKAGRLFTANYGAEFEYLGNGGHFYKIRANNRTAYVHKNYAYVYASGMAPESDGLWAVIAGNDVNVRSKASKNAQSLGKVSRGKYFKFIEFVGDWAKIVYRGKVAYVSMDYVIVCYD